MCLRPLDGSPRVGLGRLDVPEDQLGVAGVREQPLLPHLVRLAGELLEGGVISGDVKAGSLTVAAGSRMRGQVEFGWEGDTRTKSETKGFGNA